MKKQTVALLNNVTYCKFPEGVDNITQFIELFNNNYHSFVELESFLENGCVPPYFIEEDVKTEKTYWNPMIIRFVKAAESTILTRQEYTERLKKVIAEKCVHCVNYSEDCCEQDLQSHIEHIDLDGNCYGYEKKKL